MLIGRGLAGSTVRNALDPLRRIMDRALKRDLIVIDPTDGIEWPGTSRTRDRVASPAEATALIAALPDEDRALWATAMYAGLRAGELRALRVESVDVDAGVIHVVAGWDDAEGQIDVKSRSGVRAVPIIAELRPILLAHLMATGRRGRPDALVFGRTDSDPFLRSTPRSRARRAWQTAGLHPITMHECRHSYASTMVAAGVDPGEVMRRMGAQHDLDDVGPVHARLEGQRGRHRREAPGVHRPVPWASRGLVRVRSERSSAVLSVVDDPRIPCKCRLSGPERP